MLTLSAGTSVRLLGQLGVDLTGQAVRFVFEPVTPTSADAEGYVLQLGGGGSQERVATILDAAQGHAAYTLTNADTATAGTFRGAFIFNAGGIEQVFPPRGFSYWCVQEFAAPSEFTAIADFCEPVRAIMGDFRTPYEFEDGAIASVVRTVVRTGKAPRYTVSADGLNVLPAITLSGPFSQVVYWSARTLLRPIAHSQAWGSRALKVRRESRRDFLRELENEIYYLENGSGITTFQSWYSWVNSLAGINVWGLMTEMKVRAPVSTVQIGISGVQINTA